MSKTFREPFLKRLWSFAVLLAKTDMGLGVFVGVLILSVYGFTASPSVGFIDSGELMAAAATQGVMHPSGYPLLSLLGGVFAKLPLGHTPAWNLNLLTSLLGAISVAIFYALFLALLRRIPASSIGIDRYAAATGALVLGFSKSFWIQALSFEVYALHLVFMALVTLLFVQAMLPVGDPARVSERRWRLFAYFLGLGFTNHLTMVVLAPAFLVFFFARLGFSSLACKLIAKAVPVFLLGLTPYMYLPLRAGVDPMINWGEPSSLLDLWRHISGWQYQFLVSFSSDVSSRQMEYFASIVFADFAYVPLVFVLPGVWFLWRQARMLLALSVLITSGCLLFAMSYGIPDVESYFLPAYAMAGVWIACGVMWVARFAGASIARSGRRRLAAFLVLPLIPLAANLRQVDLSDDFMVEDYVRNVLGSLEPGSILLSSQSSYLTVASWYLQLVEGVRPDVIVIDVHLRQRPWYFDQLARQHPDWGREFAPEFALHRSEYERRGISSDEIALAQGAELLDRIVSASIGRRAVYITPEIEPELFSGLEPVPHGLVLRLIPKGAMENGDPGVRVSKPIFFRPFPVGGQYAGERSDIRSLYASGYVNHAIFWGGRGDQAAALMLLRRAKKMVPGFPAAVELMRRLGEYP